MLEGASRLSESAGTHEYAKQGGGTQAHDDFHYIRQDAPYYWDGPSQRSRLSDGTNLTRYYSRKHGHTLWIHSPSRSKYIKVRY